MADESTRIGTSSAGSAGLDLLRQLSGVGSVPSVSTGGAQAVAASSGGGNTAQGGAFGPRGSRVLPADTPLDQLDRRAARGTYLDILV